jgi:outer membrane lipoprotein-sorting protein
MKRLTLTLLAGAVLAALVAPAAAAQAALTPEQILARVDRNEGYASIAYTGRMEINQGTRTLIKTMAALADANGRAFIEFTNPEDQGTRYLKIGGELWMYFPDQQDTVKISGHLLKEGMMGSDLSYEDTLDNATLTDKYSLTRLADEAVDGRACFVLELAAKLKTAPYEKQKLWIDAERYVVLQAEMYAKSGKLLKTSRSLEVRQFGQRWFAVRTLMEDKLKKGTGTLFIMEDLRFDVAVPADQFSLRALSK